MRDELMNSLGSGFVFLAFVRAADIIVPPAPTWGKCFTLVVIGFGMMLISRR